jgi:hypothetical protein
MSTRKLSPAAKQSRVVKAKVPKTESAAVVKAATSRISAKATIAARADAKTKDSSKSSKKKS